MYNFSKRREKIAESGSSIEFVCFGVTAYPVCSVHGTGRIQIKKAQFILKIGCRYSNQSGKVLFSCGKMTMINLETTFGRGKSVGK